MCENKLVWISGIDTISLKKSEFRERRNPGGRGGYEGLLGEIDPELIRKEYNTKQRTNL